jgi:hypothetical protein
MKLNNPHELPMPKTNFQEVLFTLINNGKCSFFDFEYLQGFRTRISEIKELINLDLRHEKKNNKFGNSYTFSVHILHEKELNKAIDLYYESWTNKKN